MRLAFIAHDKAVEDAKEARKAEATAKLEAHSLQRRLDRSHEAELRLVVLKDRLADAEKLKTRDEMSITYPANVLEMLATEKDGPSTSAPGAIELIPTSGPPDRTLEALDIQPSLRVSTGEGSGTVIVSSDESDPATPPSTRAGPSAGIGRAPVDGEFDPCVWLDFSNTKWDRARNQLQGLVDHCLDPSLQRRRPGLGSYWEQIRHYHSDVSLRVCSRPIPTLLSFSSSCSLKCSLGDPLASFWVAHPFSLRTFSRVIGKCFIARFESQSTIVFELFPLRTFSRVVDERRDFHSTSIFEVYWQVFIGQLFPLSMFSRVVDERHDSHSTSVFELFPLRTFSRVVDERSDSHSTSVFEVCCIFSLRKENVGSAAMGRPSSVAAWYLLPSQLEHQ
ncbi:hypothetical protein PanWU01x14_344660, partial [Parasponia andersonii]